MAKPYRWLTGALMLVISFSFGQAPIQAQDRDQVEKIIQALSKLPIDYKNKGIVAEEIYRLQLSKRYPLTHYTILRNVEYYTGSRNRPSGELDIVVIKRATQKVVFVAEIKSGIRLQSFLKAQYQRRRFLNLLQKGKIVRIETTDHPQQSIPIQSFQAQEFKFVIVGNTSSMHFDYDEYLDITSFTIRQIFLRLRELTDRGKRDTQMDPNAPPVEAWLKYLSCQQIFSH